MAGSPRLSPRLALTGAAIAAAALLPLARPSRGQQPTPQPPDAPAIVSTVPATASRSRSFARIEFSFVLPSGLQLVRLPKVRSIDANGKMWEELSMYILRRTPTWNGYADLNIDSYPAGSYDVTIIVNYQRPDGTIGTATSPVKKLVVPAPLPTPSP